MSNEFKVKNGLKFPDGTVQTTASTGGATGGGTDSVFYLNDQVVTSSYTVPSGKNAGSFGPISVADGVVVTISPGSVWTVV